MDGRTERRRERERDTERGRRRERHREREEERQTQREGGGERDTDLLAKKEELRKNWLDWTFIHHGRGTGTPATPVRHDSRRARE